jgi:hypothetical protein
MPSKPEVILVEIAGLLGMDIGRTKHRPRETRKV